MKAPTFLSSLPSTYLVAALALGLVAPADTATPLDNSAAEHSIAVEIAHTRKPGPGCPPPTVKNGNQCILQGDVVLQGTLELGSDTTLDCHGHKLTPGVAGVLDNPRTTTNEFLPSQPEVAILINEAKNVKIQNCSMDGFDFGIIAVKSKPSTDTEDKPGGISKLGNRIQHNTLNVRTTGIYLLQSDNTLIADNSVTFASERGRGIAIEFDSDHNEITGNTIVSTDSASSGEVRSLPGGVFVAGVQDAGIQIGQSAGGSLLNTIIDGRLIQIGAPRALQDPEDEFRSDNNLIELNTLLYLGGSGGHCSLDPAASCVSDSECSSIGKGTCLVKQFGGITMNFGAANIIIRENAVSGRNRFGINIGGLSATVLVVGGKRGTCNLDSSRLCVTNADCAIPGFGDKGACIGAANVAVDGRTVNILAEGNILLGPFDYSAINLSQTVGSTARGNIIQGAMPVGISIANDALMSGIVERNTINGGTAGISLISGPLVTFFGAKISLNDITGYVSAVETSNGYTLLSELSVDGKGNYWGLDCPGFDPTTIRMENGQISPAVTDSHPYGQPVATTPDNSLPATCDDPARRAVEQLNDLIAVVRGFNLQKEVENSLVAKLQNAQNALNAAKAGGRLSACNLMNSFIKEVQAQTGGAITEAQAQQLIKAANQIKAVLGCPQ